MVPEEPVFAFVSGQPAILPRPEELVSQVLEWLAAQGLARPERPYQMDEEVEVTAQSGEAAVPPKAKGRSPRAGRDGATFSGKASTAKPKRVTTASLAQSLEEVLTTLPALSSQVQLLVDRQSTLEKRLVDASSVPKQLAQPLSATVALSKQGAVVDAAKLLRSPPRTIGTPLNPHLTPAHPVAPPPHRELEEEFARIRRDRDSLSCKSNACPVCSAYSAGVSSDVRCFRSDGRPLGFRNKFIYKRSVGEGQVAGRAGYSSWGVFRFRDEVNGKEDVSYYSIFRADGRPVAHYGNQRSQWSGSEDMVVIEI